MRKNLMLLFCVLFALPAAAAVVTTADQAVDLVEEALLPQGRDIVGLQVWGPIPAGTEVRSTKAAITVTSEEGYVIFIDDNPTANLFHPVRYAFVTAATGEIRVFASQAPPENYSDYQRVETEIWNTLMAAQNRRATVPSKGDGPGPTRSDRWAVLMNGGYDSSNNHVRYWNDLSNIYIALNSVYGFADDHIIVLCSDGLNPAPDQSNGQNSDPDLDGDGDDDIMYSCILANVDLVFNYLSTVLTADDKLFIFTTDHGSSAGGWNTIQNLWNHEELTDAHFASLLDALPDCEIICTFEPCYSGGFLDDTVVPPGPRVASSACRYDQVSWAMPPDYEYDTYVFHWTAAVKGEDAYGTPVNADYNGDGIITMDEAFLYAETHDQSNEDPQYSDYPVGIGQGISLWPTGSGPFLVASDTEFDEVVGNGNGAPDPGETVEMTVTLSNVGSGVATNITGTLSSTDPYLTITQNTSYFPDLAHFEQGQGSPPYVIEISDLCPQGSTVTCDLHIEADSAYANDVVISFVVGDPMYDPVGPDAYGYYAYDILDVPGAPTYDWVEICPDSGGPGTQVVFTQDDQTFQFDLPFNFRYYGQDFTRFTIAANGWVGMGDILQDDYSNSGIPNSDGPAGMIAPYWEDLSPQRSNSGGVWRWYDETLHRLIVEYNHVEQYAPTGSFETFQVVLYDPAYYPTATGDGQILFQYKDPSNTAQTEGTVGIEDPGETMGIQYLFDGAYDVHAAPIARETAILFTTMTGVPEINVQLTYVSGSPVPASGGDLVFDVYVENAGSAPVSYDAWLDIEYEGGPPTTVVQRHFDNFLPGWTINRPGMSFPVPGSYAAGNYEMYGRVGVHPDVVWDESGFPFVKSGAGAAADFRPFVPDGVPDVFGEIITNAASAALPESFSVGVYPNPFNPTAVIRFDLPRAAKVRLDVFDVGGRCVWSQPTALFSSGTNGITFDGSGLASGIYIYRLQAGAFTASGKMVLMK